MSYTLSQNHPQRRAVHNPIKGRASARRRLFTKVYLAAFYFIAGLLAASPAITRFSSLTNMDRILDAMMIAVIAIRFIEIVTLKERIKKSSLVGISIIVGYFAVSSSLLIYLGSFSRILFFLEGKILLLLVALLIFENRRLPFKATQKLLTYFFYAFVVALATWIALGTGNRFAALNESNYTILGLSLVIFLIIRTKKCPPFSLTWNVMALAALPMLAFSQSRTGVGLLLVALGSAIFNTKFTPIRTYIYFAGAALSIIALMELLPIIAPRLANLTNVATVDRFVFLREFLTYLEHASVWSIIFGGNVANVISHELGSMQWWSLRQIFKFGHEFGIAPFHFHSGIIRILGAHGIVFGGLIAYFVYRILGRENRMVFVLLALASISMSAFYLSSVIPFILLALLTPRRESIPIEPGESAAGQVTLSSHARM
jgi:hypothetical protein